MKKDYISVEVLDPDPLVRGTDPAPALDPFISKQIVRKTLIPTFCDFFVTFYL
jgi:hypothetical protein